MVEQKKWWDKNLKRVQGEFSSWIGDERAETKMIASKYIVTKDFSSVLDVGCADCSFSKSLNINFFKGKYQGVDISEYWSLFSDYKRIHADIEDLSIIKDESYDVVFVRHLLEHCPTFQKGLSEVLRVAIKEVIIVFFNKPGDEEVIRDNVDGQIVYSNFYSKDKIEKFLRKMEVKSWNWEDIGTESILYIQKI